ncbi:MAG: LUD domain-containing protein [Thermoplasmatota archaeon]
MDSTPSLRRGKDWSAPAPREIVERVAAALTAHGFATTVVADRAAAREELLRRIPPHVEIMDGTSKTLEALDVLSHFREPSHFKNVRATYEHIADPAERARARQRGGAPDWMVGSAHAVTEAGSVVIASASGSQLPPYAFGAAHAILVVGSQKIVPDLESALERIHEHALPLEEARMRAVTEGKYGSGVNKVLILNREPMHGRVSVILVEEALGF